MLEVLLVGSSEVSSDNTDFGDGLGDNGSKTVNDATVAANIPNGTTNHTDINIEPFTPCLPKNFDVSVATALDYFNLLFKPELFSDIKDHIKNYVILKQEEMQRNRNNPDFVNSVWQETTVEELKNFYDINILMDLNPLPKHKL